MDIKNKIGIYYILNKITGDFYIGSSVNLLKRKSTHFNQMKKENHPNFKLQKDYKKYGIDCFEFGIISYCKEDVLRYLEEQYMKAMKPFYNISKYTDCPMRGRKHSKETLEKLKNRNTSRGDDHYSRTVGFSDEHLENMKKARRKRKWSEEVKSKMSETAKRINSISRINLDNNKKKVIDSNGIVYESLAQASRDLGISTQAICDNLKGRSKKTKIGLTFKYYT